MENASKALLMAAGVLIGMLILSLAVYLFANFGSASAELHAQNEEAQINQFNSQFTSYEGKNDVTIYDVVTVANIATENNKYYEFPKRNSVTDGNDYYISVIFNNNNISSDYNGKQIEKGNNDKSIDIRNYYNKLIAKDIELMTVSQDKEVSDLTKYSCKTQISNTTKRVFKVTFTKL